MVEEDLEMLFTAAGYQGILSVAEIDGPGRGEVRVGEHVCAASTSKFAVGLELLYQAAVGELDPAEPPCDGI